MHSSEDDQTVEDTPACRMMADDAFAGVDAGDV